MAELFISDEKNMLYFLLSTSQEIFLSKLVFDSSGFIYYEDIKNHDIDFKDIHNLIHHHASKNYKLVENIKDKELPLHVLVDNKLYEYMNNHKL